MGSIPNSFSLAYNFPPSSDAHGDQTLDLPPPSSEAGRRCGTPSPKPLAYSPLTRRSGRYMECLRNHGATIGAHILDGCGEFMADGEDGTPESLRCAACQCHRNFHRNVQEVGGRGCLDFTSSVYLSGYQNYSARSPDKNVGFMQRKPIVMPSFVHQRQHPKSFPPAPVMVAFGGGAIRRAVGSTSSEDDLDTDNYHSIVRSDDAARTPEGHHHHRQFHSKDNKRYRTKFTQAQKEKMTSFAEKLGWKLGKHDENEMTRFCAESGVKRQAFKVWMHNSKQAMKRKLHTKD